MRGFTRCCAILAGLVALPGVACEQPAIVAVPQGAEASMDDMLAAQQEVQGYLAAMEEYLACINEEIEAAGEDAPAQFQSLMARRNNTAVDEMETVAEAFNEEIRAYREANPADEEE